MSRQDKMFLYHICINLLIYNCENLIWEMVNLLWEYAKALIKKLLP